MKACILLSVACLLLAAASPVAAQDYDVEILNFALNLEYLEANFYSCAAFGLPLNSTMTGGGPVTYCPGNGRLSDAVKALAVDIANNEIAHVAFLRSALGDAAVAQPQLNVYNAFNAAANAAFGTDVKVSAQAFFNVYKSDLTFLHGAFLLEDVGVSAYKGAAPLITNKAYLGAAAGILAVEAYHAGAVRAMLLSMATEQVFPYDVSVATATSAIASLTSAVDGLDMVNNFGVQTMFKGMTMDVIAPVDANAIAFGRLPKNVLPIVYLGGTDMGGFYPMGMNGVWNSSLTAP